MADAPVGPAAPAPADDRKYFTAIDSVNIKHPLANIANRPGLNLDARKNADDAWDSTASREAESTVLSLKVAQPYDNHITDDIIQSAESRVHALRSVDAAVNFGNADMGHMAAQMAQLIGLITTIQTDIGQIKTDMAKKTDVEALAVDVRRLDTRLSNVEARRKNLNYHIARVPQWIPLRKMVSGDGNNLVTAIKPTRLPGTRGFSVSAAMVAAAPTPAVGDVLPQASVKPRSELTPTDILDLVYFYNEDFGIVQADVQEIRIRKFFEWITDEQTI